MPDQVRSSAYRTLAAALRDAIRNGEYADGQQLPTEEQLAARHAVSRQTVRRAMQDLVSEGIIFRVAGRGTYPVAEADRYLRHFGSVEDLRPCPWTPTARSSPRCAHGGCRGRAAAAAVR